MTPLHDTPHRGDAAALHAHFGAELFRRGLHERAVEEFQRAVADDPHSADLRNDLAVALTAQGLYEEAVAALRSALKLNPDHAEARRNLTLALHAAGSDDAGPRGQRPN